MNSSHPSHLAAALLLTLGMAAPAVTAPVVVSLDHNRNRLLDTLAQIKGASDRCTYWGTFTNVERGIFLTHTDMLGARTCLENASIYSNSLDKSGNCTSTVPCNCVLGSDMALDHVVKLWTVNGNDPTCSYTEGANGYTCCNGGIEWHRTFSGADNLLISYFRNYAAGLPEWGRSTDFAGPHSPFTQESETVRGSPRGQTNFWADNSQASVLTRNGVVGVFDPQIIEMDQDYNIIHDSNPEGAYSGKYGRALYKRNWHWGQYTYTDRGDKAPTDYRGNGEPSAIPELDNTNYGIPPDVVWSPTCGGGHINPNGVVNSATGSSADIHPGVQISIFGTGFATSGQVVYVRTRSTIAALTPSSQSAGEIDVVLPTTTGTGEAYVYVTAGTVLTNLQAVTINP